jgi:hypothetical protein
LAACACGNCYRVIEAASLRWPHGAPRRLDRFVRSITFKELSHLTRFIPLYQ